MLPETRTQTAVFQIACAAFRWAKRLPLDKNHLVLMTKNSRQLYAFRFESRPGDPDYISDTEMLHDGEEIC